MPALIYAKGLRPYHEGPYCRESQWLHLSSMHFGERWGWWVVFDDERPESGPFDTFCEAWLVWEESGC